MLTQFKESFAKDLRRIGDRSALRRIREAIEQVEQAASLAEVPQLKKLSGGGPYYRIRIGDYRVGLIIEGEAVTSSGSSTAETSTGSSPDIALSHERPVLAGPCLGSLSTRSTATRAGRSSRES